MKPALRRPYQFTRLFYLNLHVLLLFRLAERRSDLQNAIIISYSDLFGADGLLEMQTALESKHE